MVVNARAGLGVLPVSVPVATHLQEQKVTAKIQINISEVQIFLGFMIVAAIVRTLTGSICTSQQRVNFSDS